jgi:hypothetical protein
MDQRKRADLALGSFLRSALGWSRALPDAERKRINSQAQSLIHIGEKVAMGMAPCKIGIVGTTSEGVSETGVVRKPLKHPPRSATVA